MWLPLFSMVWIILILGLFLYVISHPSAFEKIPHSIILLIISGLMLRTVPAFFLVPASNYDIESYRLVSQHVITFTDVYRAEDTSNRHPYLPFQMYWMGFSRLLSEKIPVPFESVVRLEPIAADILVSLLIFDYLSRRRKENPAQLMGPPLWGGLLYAVNPIAIYVSSYHSQFDSLPILFLITAILAAYNGKVVSSGLWIGFGILIKSWPILILPSLFEYFRKFRQKFQLLLFSSLVPIIAVAIYCLIYNSRVLTVIKRAVTYNHGIGIWGYTYLIREVGSLWKNAIPIINIYFGLSKFVTLAVLIIVWLLVARKQNLLAGTMTILLSFLAFSHAFSIQYLLWLVPFAILDDQVRWLKLYTISAFTYMFLAYHALILQTSITPIMLTAHVDELIKPVGLLTWVVLLAWIWRRIRGGGPTNINVSQKYIILSEDNAGSDSVNTVHDSRRTNEFELPELTPAANSR